MTEPSDPTVEGEAVATVSLVQLVDGKPVGICSARPRPNVQNNHSKGHQWWARDVYHLLATTGRTLCSRMTGGWLTIGPMDEIDHNCCEHCAAILARLPAKENPQHD